MIRSMQIQRTRSESPLSFLAFFSLLLLVASPLLLHSQTAEQAAPPVAPATVRVRVQVTSPGELPVFGAEVRAGRQVVLTGATGEAVFLVKDAPATIAVAVKAPDHYPHQTKISVAPGQDTVVSVVLQPKIVVNEAVVVTGTGTEMLALEAAVRTDLITAETTERLVKTTLAEALQANISGVRVEMNCQNCGFMQVRMNGLDGPYTQILEDGLPSYSGVTAVYGLEQIPAGFLDQIEVVKGGNSALYGPGAVAGVVNLIRREPLENRFRLDSLSGWHHGRSERQIGAAAQLARLPGGFAGDFYYRGSDRTPIDRDGDGFSDLGKRRLESGGFGLFRRTLQDRARLSVSGTAATEFRRGGDRLDLPPEQTWITEQADSRRLTAAVGWNHALSPSTYYNLRASHANYYRDTYYGSGMDPNAYGNTHNPLWVGDAQLGHQTGRHTILSGYQVWTENVTDRAPAYGRTFGGTFRNHGVYLQDEWRASSRLSLIGGARIDRSNQVARWIVSPRMGIRYAFTPSVTWRGSVSTGFRAPAIFDEDLHITQVGGEGFLLQNSASLREERSVSLSSGLNYVTNWRGRKVTLAMDLFSTGLRDTFTLQEDEVLGSGFRRLLRINGPGARVQGVNLDGTAQVNRRVGLRGGFTLQRSQWDTPEPQFGARDFFRAPRTYGFGGADIRLPRKVELSGVLDYTGSMFVPHYAGFIPEDRLERTRSFQVFHVVVSRTFEVRDRIQLRLFTNVQNIVGTYQNDLDRGPYRDSGYVYGPTDMRRVLVGITLAF
jgi:outer membrane receptor for ferrienterochelin and colicins